MRHASLVFTLLLGPFTSPSAESIALPDLIERVKPSIVGVGTYAPLRRPRAQLLGTGFAVIDGRHIATNFHVVDRLLDDTQQEMLVVFVGRGKEVDYRPAEVAQSDPRHDLAILSIEGEPLASLALAPGDPPREGSPIAFTGFPIGAILGLYPVTHTGIVSSVTPIAIPANNPGELSINRLLALKEPYDVLQLDATAYPGNSGSPLFSLDSGKVIGVISQVLVKSTKENVLKDPSAITYAVPVSFLKILERQSGRLKTETFRPAVGVRNFDIHEKL